MKQGKSIFTRLLALTLALVLIVSNANMGLALTVFAEGENKVTSGKLVADNYELTEAEKALLKSGYLVEDTYTYNVPSDPALVTVDTDTKTISAAKFEDWVATTAEVVVGGEVKETLSLTDGKATYAYDGNAFAVKVKYVLSQEVANQEKLMNVGFNLKAALADADGAAKASDSYAGVVVLAMDTLKMLTGEGWKYETFGVTKVLKLGEEAEAAVLALADQIEKNGGKMDIEVFEDNHVAAASVVKELVADGADIKAVIEDTYAKVKAINDDETIQNPNIKDYLEATDTVNYTRWTALLSNLNKLVAGLETAAKAEWNVTGLKDGLTAEQYAELDTLVTALGTKTAVTVENPLAVAETDVQANLSMFNVTVNVELKNVEDKVGSNELVADEHVETKTVTLAKDATKAEILAEVAASGVEAAAKAAWGEAYNAEHYEADATALPETLTEDITYTITYTPKTYTVTYTGDFGGKEADSVYYGYQLTLEKHADAAQAYDYKVNGNAMTQGAVYTVVGDTTVNREAGKAYSSYYLYETIAENYGNDALDAILLSGALNGDVTMNLRKPDPEDAGSLLSLAYNKLKAVGEYDADYVGLNWVPYTYGKEGNENKFNGATEVTTTEDIVKVIYRLNLTNYSETDVEKILNNAIALKAEAAAQVAALDRLKNYYDDMGSLNKTGISAIKGIIEDKPYSDELKAEMITALETIRTSNMGEDGKLKIYGMLTQYKDANVGGLTYYYSNAQAVIDEIAALEAALGDLLGTAEKKAALAEVATDAGYGQYTDKIETLKSSIEEVQADLKEPNAMINLKASAANMNNLIAALKSEAEPKAEEAGSPYLLSEKLAIADNTKAFVVVAVDINADGKADESFNNSGTYSAGDVIDTADLNAMVASVKEYAQTKLGDNYKYYTNTGLSDLENLTGKELENGTLRLTVTYNPAIYTVKVDGAADQTVTVKDLGVTLPAHPTAGYIYEYTAWAWETPVQVAQKDVDYVLTMAELDAVIAGNNTITRKEVNKAQQDLENNLGQGGDNDAGNDEADKSTLTLIYDDNKNLTGITATVDASKDSMMKFAKDLVLETGAVTIWLGDEILMEEAELSLQTLMSAILKDNAFTSQKLVALNATKGGEVFTAKMDLSFNGAEKELKDLNFTFVLNTVPAQMEKVANGLEAVKNYMSFRSNNGELHVSLNLPEKVYEVYLAALIATGNVDLDDVNAVNNEIAFNFLYDYVEYIAGSDADAQSFQNTLDLLKVEAPIDVTNYSAYYDLVKKALTADGVKIDYRENGDVMFADLTASGEKSINKLMGLVGFDPSAYSTELSMVKEYNDGESLNVTVTASLSDTTNTSDFEAVVIDLSAAKAGAADIKNGGKDGINKDLAKTLLKGEGLANGLDFTSDLPARLAELKGESVVMLLADVDGDLYFNDGAILDLNGKTVNGDITANGGNLIIVDSTLATFEAGTVTGAVNGSVHILAGKYSDDVEAFLKDGYKITDGYVQNVLYWIDGSGNDLTIVLNSDYMYEACVEGYLPSIAAIAADIAADLATKYIVPAAVSVDGHSVYNCNFNKLVTLLKSETTVKDAANMLIDCISVPELNSLANAILDDLTDLNGIYDALKNDKEIGDYTYTAAPWKVIVEYVAEGDYIDFGLAANQEMAKSTTLGLRVTGDNIAKLMELICELRDITSIDVSVDIKKPSYNDESKTLSMAGNAAVAAEFNLFNSCTYKNTDYITIFTVLFANAGAENADAMVAALNKGNYTDVKAAFDEMTVGDVFNAMKALDRPDDFVKLAESVGVTVDVTAADRLESLYHLFVVAVGKAFEKVEDGSVNNAADKVVDKVIDATDSDRVHNAIDKVTDKVVDKVGSDRVENAVDKVNDKLSDKVTTDNLNNVYGKVTNRIDAFLKAYAVPVLDKKLGALDTDNDGTYSLSFTATKRADATVRGYTADVNIEKVSFAIDVVIFDNDCLWGDVNHDNKVTPLDASLILEYYADLNPADFVCAKKADVNCDGKISPMDAALVLEYYAELIPELPHLED